jgi:hypothetical protein
LGECRERLAAAQFDERDIQLVKFFDEFHALDNNRPADTRAAGKAAKLFEFDRPIAEG